MTEDSDPDRWPVVWAESGYEDWHRHPMSMSEFLLRLVTDPLEELGALSIHDFSGAAVNDPSGVLPFRSFESNAQVAGGLERQLGVILRGLHAAAKEPEDEADELLEALGADQADVAEREWAAIQRHWQLEFPEDYQTFYDTLGPGTFCDITIVGPDAPDGWNIADLLRVTRGRANLAEFVVLHPDLHGIVPWGATADGWIFGWQPEDSGPQAWGTTAVGPRSQRADFPHLSFSSFLLHYSGVYDELAVFLFGRERWSGPPVFQGLQG